MNLKLRTKLLLAASAMSLVPLAGYHYLQGMRELVGATQESATRSAARGIARLLARSGEDFPSIGGGAASSPFLYLLPAEDAPEVDGYATDWAEIAPPLPLADSTLLAAAHGQRVYLLAALALTGPGRDAHLVLRMQDSPAFSRAWRVALHGHGRTAVEEIPPPGDGQGPGYPDPRFSSAVQPVAGGILVEMSFPRAQLGAGLALAASAGLQPNPSVELPPRGEYSLVAPRAALQARIEGLAEPGRRIWVVDRQRHVLARDGAHDPSASGGLLESALDALFPEADDSRLTLVPSTGRIEAPELERALAGTEAVRWRRAALGSERVISAAVPVAGVPGTPGDPGSRILGAVIVEDAAGALQGLHTRGLVELGLTTLAAFLVAGLVLFSVSARMVARLRELRDAAASAIDGQGRVRGDFEAVRSGDEIGDLSRSFGSAIRRIRAYNTYLEQLARRLSHELRTPVTIVRSSLENLSLTAGDESPGRVYLERAQDGVRRLDALISRMTEAARLEQAVADDEREALALSALLRACVQASNQAYPDTRVQLQCTHPEIRVSVSAQLIVQALEKLLANARDFHEPGTEVQVRSECVGPAVRISVCNTGPTLERGVRERMFDSMFSARSGRRDDGQAHLGLGLYVVRLIALGHGGDAFARNQDDGCGVCIGFTLPLDATPSS